MELIIDHRSVDQLIIDMQGISPCMPKCTFKVTNHTQNQSNNQSTNQSIIHYPIFHTPRCIEQISASVQFSNYSASTTKYSASIRSSHVTTLGIEKEAVAHWSSLSVLKYHYMDSCTIVY